MVTRDVEGWARDENALYRGDTRSPEEVRAAGGFHPHRPDAPDLRQHVHGDTNAFVSTSTDQEVGVERAGRGAVYVIHAPGGVLTDPTMRANGDTRGYGESEVLFPGGVDWRYVAGWHEVRYDPGERRLVPGPFVPNPDYIGDRVAGTPGSGAVSRSDAPPSTPQAADPTPSRAPDPAPPPRTAPDVATHSPAQAWPPARQEPAAQGRPGDARQPAPGQPGHGQARTDHPHGGQPRQDGAPHQGRQHPGQQPGQHQPGQQHPGQQHLGQQRPGQQHLGQQRPGQQQPGQQHPGQHQPGNRHPGQQSPVGQAQPHAPFRGDQFPPPTDRAQQPHPYGAHSRPPAGPFDPRVQQPRPHDTPPNPYADRTQPQHTQPQHFPPGHPPTQQPSFGPMGSEAWEARRREAEAEQARQAQRTAEQERPRRFEAPPREERPRRPLGERLRELPDERLDRHRQHMQATPAGMSIFPSGESGERYSANQVPKIPGRFVVDVHGSAGAVRVDRSNLSADDLADILMANPDWDGKTPITLAGCRTGQLPDGFAARLAERTGVPVTAPTTDAWVDYDGNMFASDTHGTPNGDRPGWPPNGEWHTFGPDGSHHVNESPYPPGHPPTWGDDLPAEAPSHATQRGEVVSELKVLEPNQVSGRSILKDVREEYVRDYRDRIEQQGKQVAVIRFDPQPTDPDSWKAKMDASRASADQKEKNIGALGYQVHHHLLPPNASREDLQALMDRFNSDSDVSGIILQMPAPQRFQDFVEQISPEKDIDALLHDDASPHDACATADGIVRVVAPFLEGRPTVAVVGSDGFVGGGVVRLLEQRGAEMVLLDQGSDLMRVRGADIVVSVTGAPRILGPEHLHEGHLLVVDSGFVPQPGTKTILSDVQQEASALPRLVTPVPGGIGPVEMAVLLDRLVRRDVDPDLPPWRVVRPEGT